VSGALKKLADVSERAQLAFWDEVARLYPEATSGDFGPDETVTFEAACDEALTRWVDYNVPVKPNKTLAAFKAGRVWSTDFDGDFPDYGHDFSEDCVGYVYEGGRIKITLMPPSHTSKNATGPEFHVELFGGEFVGTLDECEAKLYDAAFDEGFFK